MWRLLRRNEKTVGTGESYRGEPIKEGLGSQSEIGS